jgi:hypothetical protein
MARRKISLSEFARRMGTSRTAARCLLDHTVSGSTLGSLVSASAAVGMAFEPRLMEARRHATYVKKYGLDKRDPIEDAKAATYERKYRRHS